MADRTLGCTNLHKCAVEALTRLSLIHPKYDPTKQELPDGMSLTRTWKLLNERVRQENGEITFDPSITCKENLAECFRVFSHPDRNPTQMAQWYKHCSLILQCMEIMVYMDGACMNNGKKNIQCRSRVWFSQDDPRNRALWIPGEAQSNQVSKIAAVITALEMVQPYQPLKIMMDSKYVIEGLTTHLET